MNAPILPGGTVGVLGSGQLGRMFAIAARRLGYRVHTYSPDTDTPTGQVADKEVTADYLDLDRVREFARGVQVVSFEFENVPAATAEACAECTVVRPAGSVLHTTQHRLREKTFLSGNGFPVAPFAVVHSAEELQNALQTIGTPAILKTAGWGYDGKGQIRINAVEEAASAWQKLKTDEAVLEGFINFEREVSVVAARGLDGSFAPFEVIENQHKNHILDLSICPARIPPAVAKQAHEIARGIMEKLDVVGVLCVEFFLTIDHKLIVNELAPRPHNSGHLTIDAHVTCQFEQQLRAVCGLPLGSTELLRPAAMANLLGDLWEPRTPNWAALCALSDVKLHLYGKSEARPGRKMGHLNVLGATPEEAAAKALAARAALNS
ncbi:MAG: 5-(carboxyamino)imidazole ribonucleotide synthase [Planctomycetales bacterium]